MRRRLVVVAILLAVVAAGAAMVVAVPNLPEREAGVPTARVVRAPVQVTVHATGELRAGRTVTLVSPPVGGTLRIVRMYPTGTLVKAGEVVVEFDAADHEYALEQAQSEVAEADQEIVKMKADAEVQKAQDDVALLTARFDVRRAELDATGNEFIAEVEAQKNLLTLEEAKRRLAQLEEDVKSRAKTSQASLAVVLEKRNKAFLAVQRAQQVIDSLVLKAPIDGAVSSKENREGLMMFGPGMVIPEYREGDSVGSGRPVVDIIESGQMDVRAKVEESERSNLIAGQAASLHVDTIPGEVFPVRVGALSGSARRASYFESASVTRLFDVTFQIEKPDPRLKAGASARVVVEGREIPDALNIPRQAVFEKNGKTHVFAKTGDRFEQREVKVEHVTESRAVISGLAEGTEVALVDPTAASPTQAPAASPIPAGGRG
ncbi:MAG TPA: HlyD family efflux transporter periplasmic adaptor subunit [Vicinamibacterales bacterium]|nr:HlyD family efflux transporter periplasmic adaptor subunit [Vicinamibacterales bacterium]